MIIHMQSLYKIGRDSRQHLPTELEHWKRKAGEVMYPNFKLSKNQGKVTHSHTLIFFLLSYYLVI